MPNQTRQTKEAGEPTGTVRPFIPEDRGTEPMERIAHALESIAITLAAIDHNLEVLIDRMPRYR